MNIRITFLVVAIIFGVTVLSAQSKFSLGLGPKIGVNQSLMKYKEVIDERQLVQRQGFAGGIFAEVMIGKHFGIQPEVLYSQTRIDVIDRVPGTPSGFDNRYQRFTYISIPLELKYKFHGFAIYIGPQINFLTKAVDKTPNSADIRRSFDIKEHYKDKDFAAIAGIEYVLPFGLGFNFRYQRGLENIVIPDGSLERSETQELHNDLLQFNLLFRFGKRPKK